MYAMAGTGYQTRAMDAVRFIVPADVTPRAEVAREIFEELTKSVISKLPMNIRLIFKDDRNYDDGFRNGKGDALIEVLVLIDDLKKKYTEGQK